jgi:hypothetical protein
MDSIGTRFVLNTAMANINIGNFNSETYYNNINFKNLLGDDFELNADYNLILNNVTINEFSLPSTRKSGTIRLYAGGSMLFTNKDNLQNCAIYMFTPQSGGPLSSSYNLTMYQQFKLTREIGSIKIESCNNLGSTVFTVLTYGLLLFFTIRKIKYTLSRQLITNYKTNNLVLSTYTADININNVIVQWNNINFKNLLGDNYELNATYNLVLMSISIGSTTVTSANRSGHLLFESNAFKVKYSNSNKWLIPFGYTNTQPNARTFRGSSLNTFMLTSETGYIKIDHYTQNYNTIDSTVLLADKTLYFMIYKL